MNKFFAGALSGCAATVPMTATMLLLHRTLRWHEQRYPLPPEDITQELADRAEIGQHLSQGQHQVATWVSHFGFGIVAGAIYAPLTERTEASPTLKGAAFGLLVWGMSYLGLLPALEILDQPKEQPARPNWLMVIAHLVWGASLGVLADRLAEQEKTS